MGIKPSFYPRSQDPSIFNFQIVRSPKNIVGHVVFIQGLFEELNSNRHVFTKLANILYQQNFESVIFDYYGTGDSQGEPIDILLDDWRQDIIQQLESIQARSAKNITLIAFGSATLLLNDEIFNFVDVAQLWHPETNGKRYVKQLRRLALLELETEAPVYDSNLEEIAGYLCQKQLFHELANVCYTLSPNHVNKITWIECVDNIELKITNSRKKQMDQWALANNQLLIEQNKYWLASELQYPEKLIESAMVLILKNL